MSVEFKQSGGRVEFKQSGGEARAFPFDVTIEQHRTIQTGLTKREYFAAMAMQGILASETPEDDFVPATVAKRALWYADATLAALTSTEQGGAK